MKHGFSGFVQLHGERPNAQASNLRNRGILLTAAFVLAALGFAAPTTAEATTSASTPSLAAIVEHLQKHYDQTGTFSAKFSEEITPVGGMKRERSGVVYYQRPGRMRWEFAAPEKDLIVSNGAKLYSYQPDLNQVVEMPVKDAFRSSAATAFLLGMGNLKRDFKASIPADAPSSGLLRLKLVPRSGGEAIELGLDPKTYDIVALRLADQLGNVTSLRFSDIRTGLALEPGLFAFTAPAGADVVEAPSNP